MAQSSNKSEIFKRLEEQAPVLPIDKSTRLEIYFRSAHKLYSEANLQYQKQQETNATADIEHSFILLLRFVHLLLYTIPKHPEYKNPSPDQKKVIDELKVECAQSLDYLEILRKSITQHYQIESQSTTNPVSPPLRSSAVNSKSPIEHIPEIHIVPTEPVVPSTRPAPANEPDAPTEAHLPAHMPSSPSQANHHFDRSHPLYRKMEDFQFLTELGTGTFGSCYQVLDKRSNLVCVLKQIPFATPKDVKLISTEIQVLRKLSHPYIVTYYTTFVHEDSMCLVMEFCNGGDLDKWTKNREKENGWSPIDINLFFEWTDILCTAMRFVHSQEILHRDLKPSNIFLTTINNKTVLKIGDFGLSYELVKSKSRASTRAGTMIYWPPEVYNGDAPGKPADVYSLGCVLYELCMGTSRSASALLLFDKKEGLLKELFDNYNEDVFLLIKAMTQEKPSDRPSFEAILLALQSRNFKNLV